MATDRFELPTNGPCPWNVAAHSFAGWVPNVSGHLSFNLVDPHSRLPTYNHQADLGLRRNIVLHRERIAQDYPFSDAIVRRFRSSASQDFVLMAESSAVATPYFGKTGLKSSADRHGALVGAVAVLPADAEKAIERKRLDLLAHIEGRIELAVSQRSAGEGDAQERLALEIETLLRSRQSQVACYFMRFALFRTGELRIWFDDADFFGRDTHAHPVTIEEKALADSLPAQAYYFIKDLLHAHYHHHRHSDQLLPLTRLARGGTDQGVTEDEVLWRYVTLRGLARVVIELRQGRSLQGHKQALGIIAYANAFQTLLARIRRRRDIDLDHEEQDDIILYDFSNLSASIGVSDSAAESANSAKLQFFAIEVGVILSALALWAGAVQIYPIFCPPDAKVDGCTSIPRGFAVELIKLIVANPLGFIAILMVLGFLAFVGLFRGTGAMPTAERLVRFLARLSEAVGVQVSRWTRGSDILGYVLSLFLLAGCAGLLGYGAYRLAPKIPVPEAPKKQAPPMGAWSEVYGAAGKRVDQSGLLERGEAAAAIRNLLGTNYPSFTELLVGQSVVRRAADLVFITSRSGIAGDGAYLIVDPEQLRIEAGFRRDGRLVVHRTPGAAIPRPPAVLGFLGAAARADAVPVPMRTPGCTLTQSGVAGRTLQLAGTMRPEDHCDFTIDLQAGQHLAFDSRSARGLDVRISEGGQSLPLPADFKPSHSGPQSVSVSWKGWNPPPSQPLRFRPFFVRLDVH